MIQLDQNRVGHISTFSCSQHNCAKSKKEEVFVNHPKDQFISKCPFGATKSTKKQNKNCIRISALANKKQSNQKSSALYHTSCIGF